MDTSLTLPQSDPMSSKSNNGDDDDDSDDELPVPRSRDDLPEPTWIHDITGEEIVRENATIDTEEPFVAVIYSKKNGDAYIVSDKYEQFGDTEFEEE